MIDSVVRRRETGAGALPPARSVTTMLTTCAVVLLAVDALSAASLQTVDVDLNNTLPAEQYFIDKIFDKYGDKGVITFEVCANTIRPLLKLILHINVMSNRHIEFLTCIKIKSDNRFVKQF